MMHRTYTGIEVFAVDGKKLLRNLTPKTNVKL